MNLDDLIRNTREGIPVSPQDAGRHKKKIKSDKFFNVVEEVTRDGTYKGHPLTKEQRKEAFKKKGDPIKFKSFLDKVLEKKKNPNISFGGTGSSVAKPKSQKLLTGTTFAPVPEEEGTLGIKKWLDGIGKSVKRILGILETRADIAEDAAAEKGQEKEKAKRKGKEEGKEGKAKKIGIPGFAKTMAKPITSLWETIIQMLSAVVVGWGVGKIIDWFTNPQNKDAVENLKEFITVTLPPILKGLLLLVGLGLFAKLAVFTASLIKGAAGLIKGLWSFAGKLFTWAAANPAIAASIGLAALIGGAAMLGRKGEENAGEVVGDESFTANTFGSGLNVPLNPSPDLSSPSHGRNPFEGAFSGGGEVKETQLRERIETAQNEVKKYSGGGLTKGTDTVPAMLTPGEFVMSRNAVTMWGGGLLEGMNAAGGGSNLPRRANGITYAAGGGLMDGGGDVTSSSGQRISGAGRDTQLIAAAPGEFVMSKGAVDKFGSDTFANMNLAGGGTNKPGAANNIKTYWGGGQVKKDSDEPGGIMGMIAGKFTDAIKKMLNAGAAKGALVGMALAGPPGALVGAGVGAIGAMIKAQGDASSKSADQLINNPPSTGEKSNAGTIAGVSGSKGSGSASGGGEDSGPPPMFSPIDERNFSTLVTKSMYSIVE